MLDINHREHSKIGDNSYTVKLFFVPYYLEEGLVWCVLAGSELSGLGCSCRVRVVWNVLEN